jgi:LuxR family maltose regulon positive regulatory protein
MLFQDMPLYTSLPKTNFFAPIPPLQGLIPRAHLTNKLMEGISGKMTLVSAPAGYGKTTLLYSWSQFLAERSIPVVWISLGHDDNNTCQFWKKILTMLDPYMPELREETVMLLDTADDSSLRDILKKFFASAPLQDAEVVLILDNYEKVQEQAIHETLKDFITHFTPKFHIALSTRIDPPFPLACLRGYGQLLEIRATDLLCTLDEANTILASLLPLPANEKLVQALLTRTEGWIMGLRLLALEMGQQAQIEDCMRVVHEKNQSIRDYFLNEVLRQQPASVQTFLQRTSLLTPFSASLCDSVLDQAASKDIIDYSIKNNLFLFPINGRPQEYYYHPLFAELLRELLEQEHGYLVPTLHMRASNWYARHGKIHEALQSACFSQQWQRCVTLLEQYVTSQTIYQFGLESYMDWLQRIPLTVVLTRPQLCITSVHALLLLDAPHAEIEPWLQAAETVIARSNDLLAEKTGSCHLDKQRKLNQLAGAATLYRVLLAGFEEKTMALGLCQKARLLQDDQDVFYLTLALFIESQIYHYHGEVMTAAECSFEAYLLALSAEDVPLVLFLAHIHAIYLLQQSHLDEAWQILVEAIQFAETRATESPLMGCVYIQQGAILLERNQLDAALDITLHGTQLLEQANIKKFINTGYIQLARIYIAREEFIHATTTLQKSEQGQRWAHNKNYTEILFSNQYQYIRHWLACDNMRRATHWAARLTKQQKDQRTLSFYIQEQETIARVFMLLALKQPDEALKLLAPCVALDEQQGRYAELLEHLILQVRAYLLAQQEDEALQVLRQAVSLAHKGGFVRCFLEADRPLMLLLLRLSTEQKKPYPYVPVLLESFQQKGMVIPLCAETAPVVPPNLLSEREFEVLRLLGRGASNHRIAAELVVTLSTVKGHVSSIFSKLQVSNRTQAVIRARELGFLLFE